MTIEEYRGKLDDLTDAGFKDFRARYGGEWKTREDYVREYARDPRHEGLICYLLGLKTEQEKSTEAAAGSAAAAASSATTAKIACAISLLSAVAAMAALLLQA